ncbi:hypothetical protein TNCV_3614701 [Trichonephila clavipes]|uniref:DUF4817 domain-containing protein n=1 Tax=Trichonephila clavipes TaxID=2585209 RepID=A0A8X6SI66_TRICX|nr:hypothetical protein TNCV_3614701 [Trichonephila clavipes]
MVDRVKKVQCVAWFIETKSVTQTQRNYRTTYGESPPPRSSILEWYHKFMTTGSVEHKKDMVALEPAKKVWNEYVKYFVGALQNQLDKHPGSYKCQDPRYTMCFINDCDLQHTKFRFCMR